MRIGELAKESGFSNDTLRYYHRMGLVRPARVDPVSRFRDYGPEALDILSLIRAAKVAGLSLPQIRRILKAAQQGAACKEVVPLLDGKIREIDGALRALQSLRGRLVGALRGKKATRKPGPYACPILEEMGGPRNQEGMKRRE